MTTTLPEIAEFFRKALPHLSGQAPADFLRVLQWFRERDLLRVVTDANGNIEAAAAFRRIMADSPEDERRLIHREDGDTLWVDWAGALTPAARTQCTLAVVRRFPDAPLHVHGVRVRRHGRPLKLRLTRAARLFTQP